MLCNLLFYHFFQCFAADVKLEDDNESENGQNLELLEADEAVNEKVLVKVKYGKLPSLHLRNRHPIGGVCFFASELHCLLLFMNEQMTLYPDNSLSRYSGYSRVNYQDTTWFKRK